MLNYFGSSTELSIGHDLLERLNIPYKFRDQGCTWEAVVHSKIPSYPVRKLSLTLGVLRQKYLNINRDMPL